MDRGAGAHVNVHCESVHMHAHVSMHLCVHKYVRVCVQMCVWVCTCESVRGGVCMTRGAQFPTAALGVGGGRSEEWWQSP